MKKQLVYLIVTILTLFIILGIIKESSAVIIGSLPSSPPSYCGYPGFADPPQCQLSTSSVRVCDATLDFVGYSPCVNGLKRPQLSPYANCYPVSLPNGSMACQQELGPKPESKRLCTAEDYVYSDWWSACINGKQTRNYKLIGDCQYGASPQSSRSCKVCSSFKYSDWSNCINNQQTRTIISSSPNGCVDGSPVLTQYCTPIKPVCTSWTYSDWETCINEQQTRTILSSSPNGCSVEGPILTQSCKPIPTICTSYIYSDWGLCSASGQQVRTILSSSPSGCSIGSSILKQSCKSTSPNCASWTYSDWGPCSASGQQVRKILASSPSGCSVEDLVVIKSCTPALQTAATSTESIIKQSTITQDSSAQITKVTAGEKESTTTIDTKLVKRLTGQILLQVEHSGEAWYVNPKDEKKYYMANGDKAYDIMRNFGIGITNKDLEKIKTDKIFAKKNGGKIFLQVETNGEAYYIDFNGNAHYLKDGAAAYEIMRGLGLGITNDNLDKITEGGL